MLGVLAMRSMRYFDIVAARPAGAHHHPDLRGVRGEEDRRLARGVAAAHQHHLLARAELRLDGRGPEPNAAALELAQVGDVGPLVARARGDHDGACAQLLAVARAARGSAHPARFARTRGASTCIGISICAPNFSPGCIRARRASCPRCRWESRSSSRCACWRPPGRRMRWRRSPASRALPRRHRPRWTSPAGPEPTTITS